MSKLPILVSGRVQDPRGRPLEGARVYLVSGPTTFSDIAMLTDPDGGFKLAVNAVGGYTLECAADGFQSKHISFEATAGKAVSLAIALEPSPKR